MFNQVNEILLQVKHQNPLILNISNHVTLDFVANGLLSMGASPIMSFSEAEIEDLVRMSSAIVINLGTLNDTFNQLSEHVCQVGNQYGKTIILDPVGAGGSLYRTETSRFLLKKYFISVVRANAGEVMALTGIQSKTKGVDSQVNTNESVEFAKMLSLEHNVAVCMSGKVDVIIENNKKNEIDRGSSLMTKVTGAGCLLSSIVAAFNAVHADRFEAASAASLFYAVCGEIAEKKSQGPASFKMHFLDALMRGI